MRVVMFWPHLLCSLQARTGFPRFEVAEFVGNEREMVVVLRRLA